MHVPGSVLGDLDRRLAGTHWPTTRHKLRVQSISRKYVNSQFTGGSKTTGEQKKRGSITSTSSRRKLTDSRFILSIMRVPPKLAETEVKPKTGWRWTQSRANFSPPNSLLTGKFTGNIASSGEQFGNKPPPVIALARKTEFSRPIGTGNDQGTSRGRDSLILDLSESIPDQTSWSRTRFRVLLKSMDSC